GRGGGGAWGTGRLPAPGGVFAVGAAAIGGGLHGAARRAGGPWARRTVPILRSQGVRLSGRGARAVGTLHDRAPHLHADADARSSSEQPDVGRLRAALTKARDGVREVAAAIAGAGSIALPPCAVDVAIDEGVAPLLAASDAAATLDEGSRARLLDHVRASAVHGAALDEALRRLLPALETAG